MQNGFHFAGDVTGVDFEVQATLITQAETAAVLRDASDCILNQGNKHVAEFSFECRAGTHCSEAVALLLAALVHRGAEIVFGTPGTQIAAERFGMIPSYLPPEVV